MFRQSQNELTNLSQFRTGHTVSAPVDYRHLVEQDLIDLAKVFCSMSGYGSPTSMRYSIFIKRDGTVGDECFSYQRGNTAVGFHLRRLRELGMIGLCSVKVCSEGSKYYGVHISISDERFSPIAPSHQSYYFSKMLRVMEDEQGNPDFRKVELISKSV
jgi:hypothetical protein